MTYTAENIADIKRGGNFEGYMAMERKLVETLSAAKLVETVDDRGNGEMSIAHLRGEYAAWMREGEKGEWIYESSAFSRHGKTLESGPLSREWSNFPTMNAAKQYARAALRNHLEGVAAEVLKEARERLASLEAAC